MNRSKPVRARYRLFPSAGEDARERAEAIAREQTLEVPSGAATPEIERQFLGRVVDLQPVAAPADSPESGGSSAVDATLEFPPPLFDGSVTQFLNVVWGNVSLMDGVRLESVELPPWALADFPGPALGIPGIRERTGVWSRPLVCSALKPVGLDIPGLVALAQTLTRAGVDVIKDDHGLADQTMARFRERMLRVAEAVQEENARRGGRTLYLPNATAGMEHLPDRARQAREAGCAGVVVSPGLTGLDALRRLREEEPELILMAHPAHADTAPGARRGVAPELLMGTLWRLAGADCVIYVNARGRFAWPLETCQAINRRARGPLGDHRPAFPVPAGGIQAGEVSRWFETYGPDTLLLIGGSILEAADVEAAAREVVEAARRASSAGAPGDST